MAEVVEAPRLFAPLTGQDTVRRNDANARVFTGDGTPYLRVPGCKRVDDILISGYRLDAVRTEEVVVSLNFKTKDVTNPNYVLERNPDGEPILLRSVLSNDGIWQAGAVITVIGEWDEVLIKNNKEK